MGSQVLATLALRYRKSRAGKTGQAAREFRFDYEKLLKEAEAADGEARVIAERELTEAHRDGILVIKEHPRSGLKLEVRLLDEEKLFSRIEDSAPSSERAQLAADFQEAATDEVPAEYSDGWIRFCARMAEAAESGASMQPWLRSDNARYLLSLLPSLLRWQEQTLIRFASAQLCGDSKCLENLQTKLEDALAEISAGQITSLADVGILGNERWVWLHGALSLVYPEGTLDLSLLHAPVRVDHRDIKRAQLQTTARHCLTIENAAMLHQLTQAKSGVLYASSGKEGGFAHSAVVHFLNALPDSVALFHFGDADPEGFAILTDLRKRVSREIVSTGMHYRPALDSPKLEARDKRTIEGLLNQGLLTDSERETLRLMLEAGSKGRYEQEAMTREELSLALNRSH